MTPAHLIFVANDVPVSPGVTVSVSTVAEVLLRAGFWAFTESCRVWRNVRAGDRIVIYLAGPRHRSFVAEAIAHSGALDLDKAQVAILRELGLSFLAKSILLEDVAWFDTPVLIRPLVDRLGFITDKKNYGLHLRTPIVRVSSTDFDLIRALGKEPAAPTV